MKQNEIWIADLSRRMGTEPGKMRPVLIIQTDLLNKHNHLSTIIIPTTSKVKSDIELLRVNIPILEVTGLKQHSDLLIDQIRSIDNARLTKKIGHLPNFLMKKVKENIAIVLDIF